MNKDPSSVDSKMECMLIKLISDSKLMNDKDLNFAYSTLQETRNQTNRYRHGCIAISIASAMNATAFLVKKSAVSTVSKQVSIVSAFLVSVGTAGYIGNLIFAQYKKQKLAGNLKSHIMVLHKFYKLVQTIMCDINEIDKISKGSGLRNKPSEDPDNRSFGPLARFRKTIATAFIEIGKTMSNGSISLRELGPKKTEETSTLSSGTFLKLSDSIDFDETQLTANDLNNINEMYGLVQSEYVCWLTLCYCPINHKNEILIKKICLQIVESVQSVVLKYYCELNLQYSANLCGRRCDDSNIVKQNVAGDARLDALAGGTHRITLHLLSLMEEMKRLESNLFVAASLINEGKQSEEDSLRVFAKKFNDFKLILNNTNDFISKMDLYLKDEIIKIIPTSRVGGKSEKCTEHQFPGTSVGATELEITTKSDYRNHGELKEFAGTDCSEENLEVDTDEEYIPEYRQLKPDDLRKLYIPLKQVYKMHASIYERQALLKRGKSYPGLDNIYRDETTLDNLSSNLDTLSSEYIPVETGAASVEKVDVYSGRLATSTPINDESIAFFNTALESSVSESPAVTQIIKTITDPDFYVSAESGESTIYLPQSPTEGSDEMATADSITEMATADSITEMATADSVTEMATADSVTQQLFPTIEGFADFEENPM